MGASDRQEDSLGKSLTGGVGAPPDHRLAKVFGLPVPAGEHATWVSMPPAQRAKALQRMSALERFCEEDRKISAKQAAADAGVTLNRFYQMARAWRANRSLSSLGSYASAAKQRQKQKPEVVNALQAVVSKVVDGNADASIARMVKSLATVSGLSDEDLPSTNTLRLFIEREVRRRRETGEAGHEILFDCAAISLNRPDGSPHISFLIIDRGTRLILGQSIGGVGDSRDGYRQAAAEALSRLDPMTISDTPWAERIARSQLVPGEDQSAIRSLIIALKSAIGGAAPQLVTSKPYGLYIREYLGLKIGPIQLFPGRTGLGKPNSGAEMRVLPVTDAAARMEIEVTSHNRIISSGFDPKRRAKPPRDLVQLLQTMADV